MKMTIIMAMTILSLFMLSACLEVDGDTDNSTEVTEQTSTETVTTTIYTDYGDGTVTKCDDGNCTVYLLDENYYDEENVIDINDTNISD